jgi:hypothetical protein
MTGESFPPFLHLACMSHGLSAGNRLSSRRRRNKSAISLKSDGQSVSLQRLLGLEVPEHANHIGHRERQKKCTDLISPPLWQMTWRMKVSFLF